MAFTTLLHENIHATMLYQLNSEGVFNNNGTNYIILAEIWSRYIGEIRRGEDENRRLIAEYQHEVMSELTDKMKPLVKKFATDKGHTITDFEAEAICWSGLQGTTAFEELDEDMEEGDISYTRTIQDLIDTENGIDERFRFLEIG